MLSQDEDEGNEFDKDSDSIKYDVYRWSDYPEVKDVATDLYNTLDLNKLTNKIKYKHHLRVVLINLFVAFARENGSYVAYSRRKDDYKKGSRYKSIHISYKTLMNIVDLLHKHEFIEHHIGFYDKVTKKGRRSRMRATGKLMALFGDMSLAMIIQNQRPEAIILRDKNGKDIDYEDSDKTNRMRARLAKINEQLLRANLSIDVSSNALNELNKNRKSPYIVPVDLSSKTLYRVFKYSFSEGGRFYGGWWQSVPEELRRYITIDGEATIERDFSQFHPSILYAKETGSIPPVDLYQLPEFYGDKMMRELGKVILLVMLNAATEKGAALAVWNEIRQEDDVTVRDQLIALAKKHKIPALIGKYKVNHQPISAYFNSNMGLRIQYADSCLAEKIMRKLFSKNITTLPVHDSFIVQKRHDDELQRVMSDEFEAAFGVRPGIK